MALNLISRVEAKRQGLTRYFTGKPCKRGHIALRDTINATCVECTLDWKRQNPDRVKSYSFDYYREHREEELAYERQYNQTPAGKATQKRFRDKNKMKRNADIRDWRKNNPEKQKKATMNWRNKNLDQVRSIARNQYAKKYSTNVNFKLRIVLRNSVNRAIKRGHKAGSGVLDLGCSVELLKRYIEVRFHSGMTWSNWGKIWQLDHIKPLAFFDLAKRKQFLVACHYTNLQPLLILDHISKTALDRKLILMRRSNNGKYLCVDSVRPGVVRHR